MKYEVEVTEKFTTTIVVDASDEDDAYDIVNLMVADGDLDTANEYDEYDNEIVVLGEAE